MTGNYGIKALRKTQLKASPEQSSKLDPNDVITIQEGEIFNVNDYNISQKGHFRLALEDFKEPWYIYSKHWQLSWEDDEEWDKNSLYLNVGDNPPKQEEIDWNNSQQSISKHFHVYEVTQGDVRRIPKNEDVKQNILKLATELDDIRDQWGSPILVTSWYRPPLVNREVGGVSNSQHLYGLAADILPLEGSIYKFENWLDNEVWTNRALGLGSRKGFCHVDLREGDIRWIY